MLYYTFAYYTILYYTILYYTILFYALLYRIVPYYIVLYPTTLYYTILYYTVLYCTVLYHTVLCYSILYYILLYAVLYYTILYAGRPWRPPGGRPGSRCREVWGAATPPSGAPWGQSPPGGLNYSANRIESENLYHAADLSNTTIFFQKKCPGRMRASLYFPSDPWILGTSGPFYHWLDSATRDNS